jgi:hypothetical protein
MITPLEITEQIRRANAQAVANGLEGWEVEDHRIESTPVVAHEGSNLIGNEFPATPSPEPPIEVIVVPGEGFYRDEATVAAAKAEYLEWEARQEKLPVIAREKKVKAKPVPSVVESEYQVEQV